MVLSPCGLWLCHPPVHMVGGGNIWWMRRVTEVDRNGRKGDRVGESPYLLSQAEALRGWGERHREIKDRQREIHQEKEKSKFTEISKERQSYRKRY